MIRENGYSWDFTGFFLDDGLCTGLAPAVRCFLDSLVFHLRGIGLVAFVWSFLLPGVCLERAS